MESEPPASSLSTSEHATSEPTTLEDRASSGRSKGIRVAQRVLITAAVWLGVMYGLHQVMSRARSYEGDSLTSIQVPVGIFSHESYDVRADTEYSTWNLLGAEHLSDGSIFGPADGLVDRIHTLRFFGSSRTLDRKEHFAGHQSEFEEADRKLADATARFAPYFQK